MITRKVFYLLIIIYLPHFCFSQTLYNIPPNDPNWSLIKSDGFPSTDVFGDTNTCPTCFWNTLNFSDSSATLCFNASQDTLKTYSGRSVVEFYCQQQVCNRYYPDIDSLNSGGLHSNHQFKYGYYSGTMQLVNGQKYDAGFWMNNFSCTTPALWNELDMEVVNNGSNTTPYALNDILLETTANDASCLAANQNLTHDVVTSPNLASSFNVYAWDWEPNYLTYYLHRVPQLTYTTNIPDKPMNIWFDLGWTVPAVTQFLSTNTLPGKMYVDTFDLYQLKATCTLNRTLTDNSDINSFGYKVKDTIYLGNGTNSIDLGSCTPYPGYSAFVFRAVNGIEIRQYSGTTFKDSGKVLMFIPTACPQ